ncbi:hypothetical protein [Sphingomonas humi]|uniref:Lipoprotein n=1 Tax=Sphingomonas humi TaxID=335630 RepID=A0ABP7RZY9_9SPHN
MSRALAFALVPLLLLAGCGDKQPATVNESASDAGLAQENVVAGDVTAIDAATADDARMAGDMPPPALDANEAAPANDTKAEKKAPRPPRSGPKAESNSTEPAADTNAA